MDYSPLQRLSFLLSSSTLHHSDFAFHTLFLPLLALSISGFVPVLSDEVRMDRRQTVKKRVNAVWSGLVGSFFFFFFWLHASFVTPLVLCWP